MQIQKGIELIKKVRAFLDSCPKYPDNLKDTFQASWNKLCNQYGITDVPLIFTTCENFVEDEARRLASLNITTAATSNVIGLGNYAKPSMITGSNIGFENGHAKVTILGVFLFEDAILPRFYEKQLNYDKLAGVETIMQHEIGHVLSFRSKFDGLSIADYKDLKAWINKENSRIHELWDEDPSNRTMLSYYQLPLERWANDAVGIDDHDLIKAKMSLK